MKESNSQGSNSQGSNSLGSNNQGSNSKGLTAGGRERSGYRRTVAVLRRWSRALPAGAAHAPVTAGLTLSILIFGALAHARVLTDDPLHTFGLGVRSMGDGHWWTVVTSGLLEGNAIGYLVAAVLLAAVAVPVENRLGSRRFLIAVVVCQVVGAVIAVGIASILAGIDRSWGEHLHVGIAWGIGPWICGVLMMATSRMSTLWRRRIRVTTLTLLVVLALFSGHLQDLERLVAAVVGLLIGPVLIGRSPRGARLTGTRRESRVLVALVVVATTVGPVLAAMSPSAVGPLAILRDLVADHVSVDEVRDLCAVNADSAECRRGLIELRLGGIGPLLLSLMPSLLLLALADGLRRGRRFAWRAAVVVHLVLLGVALADFVERIGTESNLFVVTRQVTPFLLPAIVLVVLLWFRRSFDVVAPPGTYRRCARRIAITAVAALVIYLAGGMLVRDGFEPTARPLDLLIDAPARLVPTMILQWSVPRIVPDSAIATVLYEWVGIAFWLVVVVLIHRTFLRPALGPETAAAERARRMLTTGTGGPLSWMTTWRGNRYWFTPDGRGYVAFRVIGGVALTAGDPVGPPQRLRESLLQFAEYAAAHGWTPCFYSVAEQSARIAQDVGWTAIRVAEETVLELGSLAFTGKKFQDVRTALNRAAKSDIRAEWVRFTEASPELRDQIVVLSEEWVADKGLPEMGFTLGGLEELDDPEVRCLVALGADGSVHGVTSWLPVFRDGHVVGWTLDFMRRRSDGFRSSMEFLIASAARDLEAEGCEFVSLSGAPLATAAGEDVPEQERQFVATVGRLLDVVGRTLEPVYGFRSLLAFKAKFQPDYRPLYLVFPDEAALPSIGNAISRAYLPEVTARQGLGFVRAMLAAHRK